MRLSRGGVLETVGGSAVDMGCKSGMLLNSEQRPAFPEVRMCRE